MEPIKNNMNFRSKLRGRPLNSQCREVIGNILNFMREESEADEVIMPMKNIKERVAEATGVSLRTVYRIASEKKKIVEGETSKFSEPRKIIRRKKKKTTDISDFHKGVLKKMILDIRATEQNIPSVKVILKSFKEATGYDGSAESLRQIIRNIGFRWRYTQSHRRVLLEKIELQKLRVDYLKSIKSYRQEGRSVIYLDEIHIQIQKVRNDKASEGVLESVSKVQEFIVVNAGGKGGFIPGALLVFQSRPTPAEDEKMNFDCFSNWFKMKLLSNLPSKSVLVIEKAPYHNLQTDKTPTAYSRKQDMKEWLHAKNVPVSEEMLKLDLYNLIKQYRPRYKQFAIDGMALKENHNILRIPPYHPDMNPFVAVWSSLKQYIAAEAGPFGISDVKMLCEHFFHNYSLQQWQSSCTQAENSEDEFLNREVNIESIVDKFDIDVSDDETSEESESEISDIEFF